MKKGGTFEINLPTNSADQWDERRLWTKNGKWVFGPIPFRKRKALKRRIEFRCIEERVKFILGKEATAYLTGLDNAVRVRNYRPPPTKKKRNR